MKPSECSSRHAVVIGAGIAGMAAAAALVNHFNAVHLIDQDIGTGQPDLRKSLPQAAHVHSLLQSGQDALARAFPGFGAIAAKAGALRLQARSQWRSFSTGHWMAPNDSGVSVLSLTRPRLDALLRQALLVNTRVLPVCGKVTRLHCDATGAVSGVYLMQGRTEQILRADLVIDASGRAGQGDRWLADIGCMAVSQVTGQPEVRYVTGQFSRTVTGGADFAGWLHLANAPATVGAVLVPVEGDRWIATTTARFGATPPEDETAFRRVLAALQNDKISTLLHAERLLDCLHSYRIATVRLKRFDVTPGGIPMGFLPIGDAIASYNPLYGHGMSVAALQAEALSHALANCHFADGWRETLRDRYLPQAMIPARQAWLIGQAADFDYPQYVGDRSAEVSALNRNLRRAFIASLRNPAALSQIDRVLHMLDPLDRLEAISTRTPTSSAKYPERIM